MRRFALALSILFLGWVNAADPAVAERNFEECQALAVSHGVHRATPPRWKVITYDTSCGNGASSERSDSSLYVRAKLSSKIAKLPSRRVTQTNQRSQVKNTVADAA